MCTSREDSLIPKVFGQCFLKFLFRSINQTQNYFDHEGMLNYMHMVVIGLPIFTIFTILNWGSRRKSGCQNTYGLHTIVFSSELRPLRGKNNQLTPKGKLPLLGNIEIPFQMRFFTFSDVFVWFNQL